LLLLWLAGLCLGRKLLSRKLLLGLLLIAIWISELVEGISKLGRVEECINAVDEGLEEGSISILSNSSFRSGLLINLSDN